MLKPAGLFVALAMAVTSACVGVIAMFGLGFGQAESALVGVSALALMAVAHLALVRAPGVEQDRLDDLDRLSTELQSRIETLDVKLSTLDAAVAERARAATRPLVEEIAALGGLVTSIAKEVAAHEAALTRLVPPPPAAPSSPAKTAEDKPAVPPQPPTPSRPMAGPQPARAAAAARPQAPDPFDPLDIEPEPDAPSAALDLGVSARVGLALRDDRIDCYLQPIVQLPNRRVIHYEGLSRLREPDGLALPAEFLAAAAAEGHLAEIDRRAIGQGVAVAARLHARGRSIAIFVNLAAGTLLDDRAAAELAAFAEASPELVKLLVLELTQAAFNGLDLREQSAREALSARGFRFAIDQASDLALDPRDLARRGVRFVKAPAAALLDPDSARGAAIHAADLADLLARHGVDLIATHVENERDVPELLELGVKAAQGYLFGAPRPVRHEPPVEAPPPPEEPIPASPARRFAPRPFIRRA